MSTSTLSFCASALTSTISPSKSDSGPDVTLTERYTRVSPDYVNWEVTVNDPATWTKPYTFMIRLKKTDGLIYEYACHEGNYAMTGILAGERRQEALKRKR